MYAVVKLYKNSLGDLVVSVWEEGFEDIRDAELERGVLIATQKINPQMVQVIQYIDDSNLS